MSSCWHLKCVHRTQRGPSSTVTASPGSELHWLHGTISAWESLLCAPSLLPSKKFPWLRIFPQNIQNNNVRKYFFYYHIKAHSSEYHFLRTADYHKICLGKTRRLKTELIQRQKGKNTLFFSAGCWCCKQATILMFASPLFSLLSIFKDDSCLIFLL